MVDEKTVRHVARLARLTLTDDEISRYTGELSKILGMIEQLNTADCTQLAQVAVDADAPPMVMRADVAVVSQAAQVVLQHAPTVEDTYFQVPQIL